MIERVEKFFFEEIKSSVQRNLKESCSLYRTRDSVNYNVEPFETKSRILSKIKGFERLVM